MEPSPRLTTPPLVPPHPPPTSTYDHRVTVDDPSLQSTWYHRAWVASGCITVAISLVKCITAAIDSRTWLQPIIAGWLGYLLADLSSGVYHWAIDNYGSTSTPTFGFQIESFQYHHESPWTLTRSQFAHNILKLTRGITFAVLPLDLFCNGPFLHGFVALYSGCVMFSQHFHYWAHDTKSRHAVHHQPPYSKNYCIVSGVWNELLSAYKVFETLETFVFLKLGVRPRSWNEPKSAWVDPKGD